MKTSYFSKLTKGGLLAILALSPLAVAAESIIDNTSKEYTTGAYELNDILQLAIGFSQWLLGIVGSLALAMFVYAGFTMLISAGNPQKVTQAKNTLIASVVGLAIVFSSFILIRFLLGVFNIEWKGSDKLTPIVQTIEAGKE
jgi:hypothetical protein